MTYGSPDGGYLVGVNSYTDAKKHFDKTAPFLLNPDGPRPAGGSRTLFQYTMAKLPDGTIEFYYHGKPFAAWHRNNSVTLTSGAPPYAYSMVGPGETHVWPRDNVLLNAHGWIWHPETHAHTRNPKAFVVRFDAGCSVRLYKTHMNAKDWLIDEASISRSFRFPVMTTTPKQLSAEFRLAEFKTWLAAVSGLTDTDIGKLDDLTKTHIREDPDAALYHSRLGDFPEAFRYLQHVDRSAWGRNYDWNTRWQITPSSVDKLRNYLYSRGPRSFRYETRKVLHVGEWRKMLSYQQRFGA